MNALFTPLDMTDYEGSFVGWNELPGAVPITNHTILKPLMDETWPVNHALIALEEMEKKP